MNRFSLHSLTKMGIISFNRTIANSSAAQNTLADQTLTHRLVTLENVIASCRLIAMELDPNEATKMIIKQACSVLNAERATIFIYEPSSGMLALKVAEGATDIRIPLGKGIAGTVALTGKIVNILDAYMDPNFDSAYDIKTGYKTKSILCGPIRNTDGKIAGVIQVLNKISNTNHTGFTEMDEEILMMLAAQTGVALNNAKTHKMAVIAREKVKDVLNIVQDMHRDLGFNPLMFTISTRVQKLIESDRCTLYIVDRSKGELWTLQGEVNIRVPMNQGIAGAVATENMTVNIPDAYEDPRFNKDFDQKLGYRTKSVLVVQLINKRSKELEEEQGHLDGIFTIEDEEILGTFLNIAGPILDNSQSHYLRTMQEENQNGGTEFTGKIRQTKTNLHEAIEMKRITENEEDEEKEKELR
jgi:signal transduction protein with GAF and PtsI domain